MSDDNDLGYYIKDDDGLYFREPDFKGFKKTEEHLRKYGPGFMIRHLNLGVKYGVSSAYFNIFGQDFVLEGVVDPDRGIKDAIISLILYPDNDTYGISKAEDFWHLYTYLFRPSAKEYLLNELLADAEKDL